MENCFFGEFSGEFWRIIFLIKERVDKPKGRRVRNRKKEFQKKMENLFLFGKFRIILENKGEFVFQETGRRFFLL